MNGYLHNEVPNLNVFELLFLDGLVLVKVIQRVAESFQIMPPVQTT